MRLKKKPLQRTAAAALALSMAISAAATPAMAVYKCDISQGDVNISVDEDGNKTITVGGTTVDKEGDDEDVIIYDSRNNTADTQSSSDASAENEEKDAAPEDSAEDAPEQDTEDEASDADSEDAEDTETPEADTGDEAEADDDQPAEPATMEIEAPETEEDGQPEETGNTVSTDADGNTVIEQADTDPEPEKQATMPEAPAEEADSDEETSTYGGEAETRVSNSFTSNVIKIVNNFKDTLKVTFDNIKIKTSKDAAVSVSGKGDVEIELDGDNVVKSANEHAGIEKNDSATGKLTITDSNDTKGKLTAEGGNQAAGIGGGKRSGTSNITISGAEVEATGGVMGAGIGGGSFGNADNITIKDGAKVTATASSERYDDETGYGLSGGGAGIGGGNEANGTNILIEGSGTTVTGTGSAGGAGIGGGTGGYVNQGNASITIRDGAVVEGHGGISVSYGDYLGSGAGIGGGQYGGTSTITIDNATVRGYGEKGGIGIGSVDKADITIKGKDTEVIGETGQNGAVTCVGIGGGTDSTITIEDGKVTGKNGGLYGAGIGARPGASNTTVTIKNGTVNAEGGYGGAGIGGGYNSTNTTINISAGNITAVGGKYASGIGIGRISSKATKLTNLIINITGGIIKATGGQQASGIGAATNASSTTINISDGDVTATGGAHGAGIGGTYNSKDTTVNITGGKVNATGGLYANGIGKGNGSKNDTVTINTNDAELDVTATAGNQAASAISGEVTSAGLGENNSGVVKSILNGVLTTVHNKEYIKNTYQQDDAHLWEVTDSKAPTHSEEGYVDYKCGVEGCNETYHEVLPVVERPEVEPAAPEAPAESETAVTIPQLEVLNILNQDVINDMTKVEQTYDDSNKTLTVRADLAVATLSGTLDMLDGADTVVFVTHFGTSTLRVNELIMKFGRNASFRLVHTGPVVVLLVNGQPHNELLK